MSKSKTNQSEKQAIFNSFKKSPSKKPKVGDTVKLTGTHPFSGHIGEIVEVDCNVGFYRAAARVRIHDMQGHEVFVFGGEDYTVLK